MQEASAHHGVGPTQNRTNRVLADQTSPRDDNQDFRTHHVSLILTESPGGDPQLVFHPQKSGPSDAHLDRNLADFAPNDYR